MHRDFKTNHKPEEEDFKYIRKCISKICQSSKYIKKLPDQFL